jgi:cytoskeletal protein CcmA (bactofilin family)
MFGGNKGSQKPGAPRAQEDGKPATPISRLTIVGDHARLEGKFEVADSIQIECDVGGELHVGGRLVIGEKGVVNATVQTVDAIIMGRYEGNMVATGDVEITETGQVSGFIQTDSLVISKGGTFNGNVTKLHDRPSPPRLVHLVEDGQADQQSAQR